MPAVAVTEGKYGGRRLLQVEEALGTDAITKGVEVGLFKLSVMPALVSAVPVGLVNVMVSVLLLPSAKLAGENALDTLAEVTVIVAVAAVALEIF